MADTVAVVTDSTACLGPDIAGDLGADADLGVDGDLGVGGGVGHGGAGLAGGAGPDVRVVPLRVVVGGQVYDDTPAGGIDVAAALRRGITVTTARPSPQRFARVYAEVAATGAPGIVSVHLSGRMSGTVDSARLAAEAATVPVLVLDARTAGAGLGFVVAAAVAAARSGRTLTEVAVVATRRSTRLRSLFCLGSLDQLRKGGRAGGGPLPGNALGGKQLLRIADGQIVPFEKVRTMARALARLEELAAELTAEPASRCTPGAAFEFTPTKASELAREFAAESVTGAAVGHNKPVDVAVQHVASKERAARLAARLQARIPGLRELHISEAGPAMAAHTGPDMLGVVVARY